MPNININGYNVGTDISLTISDVWGDIFPASFFGLLTDFRAKMTNSKLAVVPITNGGVPIFQTIWGGVNGSMSFVRTNGAFQQFFSELIDAYHDFGLITQLSMSADVLNRDGTIDEYLYTGFQFSDPDFGNFRNTKEVDMTVNFEASRLKITGNVSLLLTGLPTAA